MTDKKLSPKYQIGEVIQVNSYDYDISKVGTIESIQIYQELGEFLYSYKLSDETEYVDEKDIVGVYLDMVKR